MLMMWSCSCPQTLTLSVYWDSLCEDLLRLFAPQFVQRQLRFQDWRLAKVGSNLILADRRPLVSQLSLIIILVYLLRRSDWTGAEPHVV